MKAFLERYFLRAMGAMAKGYFASFVLGVFFGQLSRIPYLGFLARIADLLGDASPAVGAAIGVCVAFSLGAKGMLLCGGALTGAVGYAFGGPLGAFLACTVGNEIGSLLAGKTKLDIFLTPFLALLTGGALGVFVCPYIARFSAFLGGFVGSMTEAHPIVMGTVIAAAVGMAATAPFSAVALCASAGLSGIAAGAACVGVCCQTVGFAVAGLRDNGVLRSIPVGIGTPMLQFPNVLKRPQIWLAPTLASALLGPVSAVLGMENTARGAALGTCGFVGQLDAFAANGFTVQSALQVLFLHFLLPVMLVLMFDLLFRRLGWVKKGQMYLQ